MYKISIKVFIWVDLHKKIHSVLIGSSRDIKLRTSSKLKKSFQFCQLSKFYISPPDYQNGMKFFVQIDPDENLYWYFIHLGQIWLPLCMRVLTKCMNLQSGVWIYGGGFLHFSCNGSPKRPRRSRNPVTGILLCSSNYPSMHDITNSIYFGKSHQLQAFNYWHCKTSWLSLVPKWWEDSVVMSAVGQGSTGLQ